jgi:hypothetical protein
VSVEFIEALERSARVMAGSPVILFNQTQAVRQPKIGYHGTAACHRDSILRHGLIAQDRPASPRACARVGCNRWFRPTRRQLGEGYGDYCSTTCSAEAGVRAGRESATRRSRGRGGWTAVWVCQSLELARELWGLNTLSGAVTPLDIWSVDLRGLRLEHDNADAGSWRVLEHVAARRLTLVQEWTCTPRYPQLPLLREVELRSAGIVSCGRHGWEHARRVAATAAKIAESEGGDVAVAIAFGLLHDAMRFDDLADVGHGARAVQLADELAARGLLRLDRQVQMPLLRFALLHHEDRKISSNPTVGACWDGDRLNLIGGREPHRELLSTASALDLMHWARNIADTGEPSWPELVARMLAIVLWQPKI